MTWPGDLANVEPNPGDTCMCGCGQKTKLASQTDTRKGWVFGKPMRFILGHQCRKSRIEYVETDCGYETPCWIWQRTLSRGGYGQLWSGGRLQYAHRVYYTRKKGAIPDGLHIDHLCRIRACVNPDHLEAVTQQENNRRSRQARKGVA